MNFEREHLVLVHIKTAMFITGKTSKALVDMAAGYSLLDESLKFVFNVAANPNGEQRELRFWSGELYRAKIGLRSEFDLDEALNFILPPTVSQYPAGRVIALLNIEWQSLARLRGELGAPQGMVPRAALVKFLSRRWVAAPPSAFSAFSAVKSKLEVA